MDTKSQADVLVGVLEAKVAVQAKHIEALRTALSTVLDQVDYDHGMCGPTEMVAAVLPVEVIALARAAIAQEKP